MYLRFYISFNFVIIRSKTCAVYFLVFEKEVLISPKKYQYIQVIT